MSARRGAQASRFDGDDAGGGGPDDSVAPSSGSAIDASESTRQIAPKLSSL